MPVHARLVSDFIVEFSRLDMELLTKQGWRNAIMEAGEVLQEQISESFASERVGGSSQLRTNTLQWNQRKAKEGLDPRRGHATNFLQGVLDGGPLFRVAAITVNKRGLGRARLYFEESKLHRRVSYAEYYEAAKVRRRGILVVAKAWLSSALAVLRAREAASAIKKRRARGRSTARAAGAGVAARAGRIIRRIG